MLSPGPEIYRSMRRRRLPPGLPGGRGMWRAWVHLACLALAEGGFSPLSPSSPLGLAPRTPGSQPRSDGIIRHGSARRGEPELLERGFTENGRGRESARGMRRFDAIVHPLSRRASEASATERRLALLASPPPVPPPVPPPPSKPPFAPQSLSFVELIKSYGVIGLGFHLSTWASSVVVTFTGISLFGDQLSELPGICFRPPTHFSHMSHPTFAISHIL